MTGPWDDYRKGRDYENKDDCSDVSVGDKGNKICDKAKVGWSGKYEACWSKKRKDGSIIPLEERNRDHQIDKKNCTRVNGCNNQNDWSVYYDTENKCPATDKIADFGGMRSKKNPDNFKLGSSYFDSPKINLPPLNNEV